MTSQPSSRPRDSQELRPSWDQYGQWFRRPPVLIVPIAAVLILNLIYRSGLTITASPSDQRRWIIVSFTTVGDGDAEGEFSLLMVELFDAIMSTWRWLEDS